jgi:hypothetical protein
MCALRAYPGLASAVCAGKLVLLLLGLAACLVGENKVVLNMVVVALTASICTG